MKQRDLLDLLLLAAVWGCAFLFIRLAAPAFGPIGLAFVRVSGAALVLAPLLFWRGEAGAVRRHAGALFWVGLTNSALPFALFGYAMLTLPAGLASIFNAATPLATALIAWAWLRDPLTRTQGLGLALGFAGVLGLAVQKSLRTGGLTLQADTATMLAIGACLLGTLMYGLAAALARRYLQGVPSLAMAAGTQAAAGLALALPAALTWPRHPIAASAWATAAALAVLCSGLAYVLYFRLLSRVGATQAASVTFLVPVFASAWGALLLDEPITGAMLAGGAVILAGTALVLKLWPRRPRLGA